MESLKGISFAFDGEFLLNYESLKKLLILYGGIFHSTTTQYTNFLVTTNYSTSFGFSSEATPCITLQDNQKISKVQKQQNAGSKIQIITDRLFFGYLNYKKPIFDFIKNNSGWWIDNEEYKSFPISEVEISQFEKLIDEARYNNASLPTQLFEGTVFVISGNCNEYERADLIQIIESYGGEHRTHISNLVDIVVNFNPKGKTTGKIKEAIKLQETGDDIRIIEGEEFLDVIRAIKTS